MCSPLWTPAIMERVARMYERDKTHPCILMWSLGNESGHGPALDAAAAYLRARDPSRPVHYEVGEAWPHTHLVPQHTPCIIPRHLAALRQGGGSRTRATDVVCPMYPRTPQIKALLKVSVALGPAGDCTSGCVAYLAAPCTHLP